MSACPITRKTYGVEVPLRNVRLTSLPSLSCEMKRRFEEVGSAEEETSMEPLRAVSTMQHMRPVANSQPTPTPERPSWRHGGAAPLETPFCGVAPSAPVVVVPAVPTTPAATLDRGQLPNNAVPALSFAENKKMHWRVPGAPPCAASLNRADGTRAETRIVLPDAMS